jgi:hypothetical protein
MSEDQNRKPQEAAPTLVGFNSGSGPKPGATVLAQGSAPDARWQNPVTLAFRQRRIHRLQLALEEGTGALGHLS